jgi:PST family polysaccharide transporter
MPTNTESPAAAGHKQAVWHKMLHGIGWSTCQNLTSQAVSLVIFVVLTRLLAAGDFGLVAYASVFIAFVQMFVEQGIPDAVVQGKDLDEEDFDAAFWFNLGLSVVLAALVFFAAPLAAKYLHEPRLAVILPWLGLVLPLYGLVTIQQAILRRRMHYRPLAIRTILGTVGGGVAGIVMAFLHCGVWSLVGQVLANGFVGVVVLWSVAEWRPRWRLSWSRLRRMRGFATHVTISAFLDYFNRRGDDFLIGYCLGPVALGYYSVAYKILLTLTRLLTSPLNSVALPTFSQLQGDRDAFVETFFRFTRGAAFFSFSAFLGVAAVAPEFVSLCFGSQWGPSVPVLRILCLIGLLHSVALLHGTAIRALGKAHWQMWFTLGGAVTNVVGFLIAVRYGISAVAAAYVLSGYLWLAVDLLLLRKALGISVVAYFQRLSLPAGASVVMAAMVFLSRSIFVGQLPLLGSLVLSASIGVVVFAAIVSIGDRRIPQFVRATIARTFRPTTPAPIS